MNMFRDDSEVCLPATTERTPELFPEFIGECFDGGYAMQGRLQNEGV